MDSLHLSGRLLYGVTQTEISEIALLAESLLNYLFKPIQFNCHYYTWNIQQIYIDIIL